MDNPCTRPIRCKSSLQMTHYWKPYQLPRTCIMFLNFEPRDENMGKLNNNFPYFRFILRGGLHLALACYEQSSHDKTVTKPILGALDNVAEVQIFRQGFLTADVITMLCDMLQSWYISFFFFKEKI